MFQAYRQVFLACFCIGLLLPVASREWRADRVTLKDGRVLRGVFLNVDERGRLRIRSGGRIIVVPMHEIRSMKREPREPGAKAKVRPPRNTVPKRTKKAASASALPREPLPPARATEDLPKPGSSGLEIPEPDRVLIPREPLSERSVEKQAKPAGSWNPAYLVPGLPQIQSGSRTKGWSLAGGFSFALVSAYYHIDLMQSIADQANTDPAYHLNLAPGYDRRFGAARDGFFASLAAGLFVYGFHVGDVLFARVQLGPDSAMAGSGSSALEVPEVMLRVSLRF